jgi:hypothetical protein
MKTYVAILTVVLAVLTRPALAQVNPLPLGVASPLGIGPSAQVPPVGVPLGATQLVPSGLSPVVAR